LDSYPRSIDVTYKQARITVSRFPHGGKRACQKSTYKLIDKIYKQYLKRNDNLFILFIDSDCILDKVCIQNFMYEMELKPGSKRNMLAMTGVITSTTEKNSLITLLQDMEYIHGQLFERSVESGCGAVTCLPGALTMLRFSAFRKMAKYYFADKAEQCDDLFDYGKCHLGEDRWLTHLFMIGAKERYQIQMCTGAFCKTEAVQTYRSLLKQRRRWFLGFITNEVCMLTDVRLWRKYPLLCVVRFMQNTVRTTALLFFIMVLSIITTETKISHLPVGFIAVSLGLNWLLMIYFGAKLRRFKIWLYPIMFFLNPFFNWVYMVYAIFTAGQRTWGGPRADAGAADVHTTPRQAIDHALATGDDLNVVPETFKPAIEARQSSKGAGTAPVQPLPHLEGRFAAAERLPGGWYLQNNDSGITLPNMLSRNPAAPHVPLHPRASFDSATTIESTSNTICMPRRVESIMDVEDRRKYLFAQQAQMDAGTVYGVSSRPGPVYEILDAADANPAWVPGIPSSGGSGSAAVVRSQHYRSPSGQSLSSLRPGTPAVLGRQLPLAAPQAVYQRSQSLPIDPRRPLTRLLPTGQLPDDEGRGQSAVVEELVGRPSLGGPLGPEAERTESGERDAASVGG
jgi:chitin synthase